ncbi:MAG: hypothetical protein U0Z44_02840 [Kouleothrix sp.]
MNNQNDSSRPWQVLRRETICESQWVCPRDDVRLPDGSIVHNTMCSITRARRCAWCQWATMAILLIEHYNFVPIRLAGSAGGRVDQGEALEAAAARELHGRPAIPLLIRVPWPVLPAMAAQT